MKILGITAERDALQKLVVGIQTNWKDHVVILALVALIGMFTYTTDGFASSANIVNILRQTAVITVLGIGLTFAIISAEIDISIGGIMALSAMVTAYVLAMGYAWYVGALAGVLTGVGFGLFNGIAAAVVGIPSFLVTLGTLGITRGLSLMISETRPIRVTEQTFLDFFGGELFGWPVIIPWMLVIALVAHVVLSKTRFGRHVYATGDQERAARYTGINSTRVKIITLTLSGLTAGLAALLLIGRLQAARPEMGTGIELSVIAAVIIGGTSLFGGKGWIPGTVIGALLITVIDNGLVLNGYSTQHQQLVRGVVIILAVAFRGTEEGDLWL